MNYFVELVRPFEPLWKIIATLLGQSNHVLIGLNVSKWVHTFPKLLDIFKLVWKHILQTIHFHLFQLKTPFKPLCKKTATLGQSSQVTFHILKMKTPFKEKSHLEKNISKMKICFWKSEKELILFSKKIKTPFQPLCKENCYSSWSVTKPFIFWKGKHLLKKDPILKMKALSKNILKMKTCFWKKLKTPF